MRTADERARDVGRLVDAASRLARRETIVAPLVETTGLSPEGVRLALAEHLETSPSDDEIDSLVRSAGDAPVVYVVLSANVFTAALRAIAIARAAAPRVVVRPSSREPVFARALVEEARDPDVTIDAALDVATVEEGEIHVYGRDATIARVQGVARVPVRGHGAGLGVACVGLGDVAAAEALARDVAAFDQRGCLSPRIAVIVGEVDARRFAARLHEALDLAERRVPRGRLFADEAAALTRWRASMEYAGSTWCSEKHAVALAPAIDVPPPGRHLHVVHAATTDDARALLAPIARFITTFGGDVPDIAERVAAVSAGGARVTRLGAMQKPPFDGPVDAREGGARRTEIG